MNDYQEINKKTYNNIANSWDKKRPNVKEFFEDFLKNNPKGKLLDVGCGSGKHLVIAKNLGFEPKGVDFSEKLIQIAKSKGINAQVQNILLLKEKDNAYDLVTCIAVIHHMIEDKNVIKALNELFRVLKPGGKLFISYWLFIGNKTEFRNDKKVDLDKNISRITFTHEGNKYPRIYRQFQRKEFEEFCKNAGFSVIKVVNDNKNYCFTLQKPY